MYIFPYNDMYITWMGDVIAKEGAVQNYDGIWSPKITKMTEYLGRVLGCIRYMYTLMYQNSKMIAGTGIKTLYIIVCHCTSKLLPVIVDNKLALPI